MNATKKIITGLLIVSCRPVMSLQWKILVVFRPDLWWQRQSLCRFYKECFWPEILSVFYADRCRLWVVPLWDTVMTGESRCEAVTGRAVLQYLLSSVFELPLILGLGHPWGAPLVQMCLWTITWGGKWYYWLRSGEFLKLCCPYAHLQHMDLFLSLKNVVVYTDFFI